MDDTLEYPGRTDTGRMNQLEQWKLKPAGFTVPQGPSAVLIEPVEDADILSDLYLHIAPGCH